MAEYELTFDEDGVPWASPEIQKDYEAALGRFMVAFNRLDNLLSEVIETVLVKLNRTDLVKQCTDANYAQRVLILDLLKQSTEGDSVARAPIKLMKDVAGHRNIVAHGHFDQNPFTGEYDIVKSKSYQYTPANLDTQTANATEAWYALRHTAIYYAFADEPTS